MRNEWLEDFRLELYALGKAIWDYQENIPGAILDVYHELQRVAKQVIREFVSDKLLPETRDKLIKECVLHMTVCDQKRLANGTMEVILGTSLLDRIDLITQDSFGYTVKHMTEYLQNNQ